MAGVLAPQLAVAAGLIGALSAGIERRASSAMLRALAIAALAAALSLTAVVTLGVHGPLLKLDLLGRCWQWLFYVGAAPAALLLAMDDEVPAALLLASVLGMGLLAASGSLILLFIGLEFMSLPAYLLVARAGERRDAAREAALKYFFAGSTAGALFLLGLALRFAATGTLMFAPGAGRLAEAGLALMGAAALFKIGAVPLHFWLPDAYEAATPELAGFLSTSMKSAAVLLLMRIVSLAPHSALARALPCVAALTMVTGAVLALRQQKLQRLLAYSSVSHAGFLLLGVGAWAVRGAAPPAAVPVFCYLAAYVVMSNGAFAFLRASGATTRADLRGLASREPLLAALLTLILLSLGGIPPTAGFLAKLLVLWDSIQSGLYWAAAAGAVAALISLGYYLGLVRDLYFETGGVGLRPGARARSATVVLAVCAAAASVLGALPGLVTAAGRALGVL